MDRRTTEPGFEARISFASEGDKGKRVGVWTCKVGSVIAPQYVEQTTHLEESIADLNEAKLFVSVLSPTVYDTRGNPQARLADNH